ncbi:MAG: hypothetical protein ACYCOO_07795, partial [Chitinophagaceae bacterium]
MRFSIVIFFSMALSYLAGIWLPWWSLSVCCFLVALVIPQAPLKGFLSAFLAIFLLWGGLALFIDVRNGHILSRRMSQLFFHQSNPFLILGLTALLGAITG